MSNEELDRYTSELRAVLKFIKYSKDKEALNNAVKNDPKYRNLSDEAVNMINNFTNVKLEFVKTEQGGNDMCIALQQMRDDAVSFGIEKKTYDVVNNMLLMKKFTKEDIIAVSGCTLEQVNAIADGTYKLH